MRVVYISCFYEGIKLLVFLNSFSGRFGKSDKIFSIFNTSEPQTLRRRARMENDNNDKEKLRKNKELVFNYIKSVKVNGIAELLQHLNYIPIEHLTSPSFLNKLGHTLQGDLIKSSLGYTIPLKNIIYNNYPSNSLKFLEYLKDKGLNIKKLICLPQIYFPIIRSSLKLYYKIENQIMLKNKIEEKAQLELVKMIIELSLEDNINGNEEKMKGDALESRYLKTIKYFVALNIADIKGYEGTMMKDALESCNLKIIKYFVSLNIGNIKQSVLSCNGLHIVLERYLDKCERERLKLIKYLVDQGVDIHQRNNNNETILHLAARNQSLKIIKYLVSLGIGIHSLDKHNKNTVLLSAITSRYNEKVVKVAKYFISIGVNIEHQNKDGMDVLLYSLEYGNFEFIKYIGSLMPSLKSPDRYNIKSTHFQKAISNLLKSFNIEMIKYLDEFPCFTNYFDGENKIKSKNSILFQLISYFKHDQKIKFSQFKEIFEFFLNKRNIINSIDMYDRIAIQQELYYDVICKSRKYWDYLIEKGINLHHLSTDSYSNNSRTVLYFIHDRRKNSYKRTNDNALYIMIRSMEINSQIVDHPKFKDLKDEDRFEDFFRKDEEEENEEKVINWKRGMAEILMKYPNILNLVSTGCNFHEILLNQFVLKGKRN